MKNKLIFLTLCLTIKLYGMNEEKEKERDVKKAAHQASESRHTHNPTEKTNFFVDELVELYEEHREDSSVHAKIINKIFNNYRDNPNDIDCLLSFANHFLKQESDEFLKIVKYGCLNFIAKIAYNKIAQIGSVSLENYKTQNGWIGRYDAPYLKYKTYNELCNAWFVDKNEVEPSSPELRSKKNQGCQWLLERNLSKDDSKSVADVILRQGSVLKTPDRVYYHTSYGLHFEINAIAAAQNGDLALGCNDDNKSILLRRHDKPNRHYEIRRNGRELSQGKITDMCFSPQDKLFALAFTKAPYIAVLDHTKFHDPKLIFDPEKMSKEDIEKHLEFAKSHHLNLTRDTKEKSYIEPKMLFDGVSIKFPSLFVIKPSVKNVDTKVVMDGGHTAAVTSLDFSPKTSKLITIGQDKHLYEWQDLDTKPAIGIPFKESVMAVQYSKVDDNIFAVAGDEAVKIYDSRTGREAQNGELKFGKYSSCVNGSPDGTEWIAATYYGYLLYDQRKGAIRHESNLNKSALAVEFCPDGNGDYSVQTDDGFQLFDMHGNMKRRNLNPKGFQAKKGCFSKDGSNFAIIGWYAKLAWNNPSRFAQGTTLCKYSLYNEKNEEELLAGQALDKRYLEEIQDKIQLEDYISKIH